MIVRRCATKGAFEVIPDHVFSFDLSKLKSNFRITFEVPMLVMLEYGEYVVTCYKNGKLLIKNCDSEEEAEDIAKLIYK